MIPRMTVTTRTSSSSPARRCKRQRQFIRQLANPFYLLGKWLLFDDTVSRLSLCSMEAVYSLLLCIAERKVSQVILQASIIRFHVAVGGSELSSSILLWILLFAPALEERIRCSVARVEWSWIHDVDYSLRILGHFPCDNISFSSPFSSFPKLPKQLSQNLSVLCGLHLPVAGGRFDSTSNYRLLYALII